MATKSTTSPARAAKATGGRGSRGAHKAEVNGIGTTSVEPPKPKPSRAGRDVPQPTNDQSTDVDRPAPFRVRQQPRPPSTGAQQRAAKNLVDALGGPQSLTPLLRSTGKPKAYKLADVIDDPKFDSTTFHHKLTTVGMTLLDFTELLLDASKAAAVARLVMSAGEVAEGIRSRAVDTQVLHTACFGSGREIHDDPNGMPYVSEFACVACDGTGWVVKPPDKEWVDLYLELIQMRKNAPMVSLTRNVTNQNLNVAGDLVTGDGAPQIDSIIRRADQQMLPPPNRTLTDGSERVPAMVGMPEDLVDDNAPVEAELVEAAE